jgi:hypothetical protein
MARPRKNPPKVKNYTDDLQDTLVKRITECKEFLEHIKICPAFATLKKDLERNKQIIDDHWQELADGDPKLREMRVSKLAYMHLLNIEAGYQMDLEESTKELDKLQNQETKIVKDYDAR